MTAVEVARDGAVCRVTLNRPEKLNALNDEVRRGLQDAFSSVADDMSVRIVVLSGAGRAFSAGADLMARAARREAPDWSERRHSSGAWQRLLDLMESLPQVTVAVLHGHVIGGAALLAAACDIRLAADDIRVAIPEVAIGIPLTWAGLPRLVREIGLPMTRDLVMTGRTLTGAEVLACGFAQRVVARGELEPAERVLLDELLAMPAAPLAMTRAALAAIGRAFPGNAAGWADADLLMWSGREPESTDAAAEYLRRRLSKS